MTSRKPIILFFFLFSAALWGSVGCKKAGQSKVNALPEASTSAKKMEIPAKIGSAERARYVRRLYFMSDRHPQRRILRDRLVESLATSFKSVAEQDHKKRLALFTSALHLHLPSDFASKLVSESLFPMAKWTVATYEKMGDEAITLAGLKVLSLIKPKELQYAERYQTLLEWSNNVRGTVPDKLNRYASLAAMYQKLVQLVPDIKIIDKLSEILVLRHSAHLALYQEIESMQGGISPLAFQMLMQPRGGIGKDIIYIYFLAGNPELALKRIKTLGIEESISSENIELLEQIEDEDDLAVSYFNLANLFGAEDPRAGLQACIKAKQYDERDFRYARCVGQFFQMMNQPINAIELYYEMTSIESEQVVYLQALDLVRNALVAVHRMENVAAAKQAISLSKKLVTRVLANTSKDENEVIISSASLLYAIGEISYDNGWIDEAQQLFSQSVKIYPPLLDAEIKLADILGRRGLYQKAIELLTGALEKGDKRTSRISAFWRSAILQERGNNYLIIGNRNAAIKDFQEAMVEISKANVVSSLLPTVEIRKGILYHQLGNREKSQDAFREAIKLNPERRATYAELISYLVISERLEDATEFYRLAFNQDRIDDMWKIYYALWVEGLARRVSGKSFDLASTYLQQSNGNSWQDELARFFSGRINLDELRKKATNIGQKVEVEYYGAIKNFWDGNHKQAMAMLEKVVKSDMMGFFEYKMALELLRKKQHAHVSENR